mmetsp:Transcript_43261/g.106273  ORF Transcript_43261/g.106273 Transcript_43261/m.106273 type:complete len:83 (-) Transcript_43261:553-801(-)|eukprot:CAMPEP_0198319378 /NCGR_PEP_ID=MMETSP1450-20131203/8527_1 /TAXON_ID=753684 ORGANISM="Madagascaria erythrocladiodes, Strain CCMP3234" /NCGR_SAMPLE_ID=MMETSP1450 /ASSEMBLY_ACC=CAM_ASM_001115 /LENGTH=82 /DNA_ID=CAMNT_0044022751 /DNA_START=110 /DNA_END=358 /DNA_ORIENTATION=+
MAFLSGITIAITAPATGKAVCGRTIVADGKGFGGGEATRDPEPTKIDPNDPKGKQKAIHKAVGFEEYMRKRQQGGGGQQRRQ